MHRNVVTTNFIAEKHATGFCLRPCQLIFLIYMLFAIMDPIMFKATRGGNVEDLLNLLEANPLILERQVTAFADRYSSPCSCHAGTP